MDARQTSLDLDKLILDFGWDLFNHCPHLDCRSFVDLHLDLFPQLELVE